MFLSFIRRQNKGISDQLFIHHYKDIWSENYIVFIFLNFLKSNDVHVVNLRILAVTQYIVCSAESTGCKKQTTKIPFYSARFTVNTVVLRIYIMQCDACDVCMNFVSLVS